MDTPKMHTSSISRSLLTPCRRVGLSRNMKTPNTTNPEVVTPQQRLPINPLDDFKYSRADQAVVTNLPTKPYSNEISKVKPRRLGLIKKVRDITPGGQLDNVLNSQKQAPTRNFTSLAEVNFESSPNIRTNETRRLGLIKKVRDITPGGQLDNVLNSQKQAPTRNFTTLAEVNFESSPNIRTNDIKIEASQMKSERQETTPETDFPELDILESPLKMSETEPQEKMENEINTSSNEHVFPVTTNVTVQVHQIPHNTEDHANVSDNIRQSLNRLDSPLALILSQHDNPAINKDDNELTLNRVDIENHEKSDISNQELSFQYGSRQNITPKSRTSGSLSLAKFTTEDYLDELSKNSKSLNSSMHSSMENLLSDDLIDFQPTKKLKTSKSKNYKAFTFRSIINSNMDKSKEPSGTVSSVERNDMVLIQKDKRKPLSGKKSSQDFSKTLSKNILIFDDDDEDIFSSSPESEKEQRVNLIRIISELEHDISFKQDMVERLKRVVIYKQKHNLINIQSCCDIWVGACCVALKDLLIKVNNHGPIEMDGLIKNLGIPSNIVKKLPL